MHEDARWPRANQQTTIASAPGRVNLIGEHTDYNGGFVLPTAIPQHTRVELRARTDRQVRLWSATHSANGRYLAYTLGQEAPTRSWIDYVQGVTRALEYGGHVIGGFEARIRSTVPAGSGLSSSAALEISVLRALRAAFELNLDDVQVALLGQQAENDFVGARVGIMDQMAASLADTSTALFLDTRSLDFRRVPLPRGADLLVIHSGITHSHASGEYNRRRSECEEAARLLGVEQLRDCTLDDLPRVNKLPGTLAARARHVITENARVLASVSAMEADDVDGLGRLFNASHASMRDDYQVSIPEIDALVELATNDADIFGARLTGGGFGGSIVALVRPCTASVAGTRIVAAYFKHTGRSARMIVPPNERGREGETWQ